MSSIFWDDLKKKIKDEYCQTIGYLRSIFKEISGEELPLPPYEPDKHGPLVTFEGLKGYEEVERYWVDEPYAFISILYNTERKEYFYFVAEPELNIFEKMVLETVHENILDMLSYDLAKNISKEKVLEETTLQLLNSYALDIEIASLYKILYYIKRNYIGYERINVLMKDPNIEDISCDGINVSLYIYHIKYHSTRTNISFEEEVLDSFIIKLAQICGKHISIAEPLVNATLPGGSRLNASLGKEITFRGGSFTIRKFSEDVYTPIDLLNFGTFSSEMLAYFWLVVENKKSFMFAGATASGKTTSMNAISIFIPASAKIVSIEDTHEMRLYHDNWIGALTRETFIKGVSDIDMYELLRQALRQRPEYIIVGEIRGKEALTLFQAMSTGHTTFSTMHAGTLFDVINRLEGEPINVPHVMIPALDVISIQGMIYFGEEKVRRVTEVIEITGIDEASNDLSYNELFAWDSLTDTFKKLGVSHLLDMIMKQRGWDKLHLEQELNDRKRVIEYMKDRNIADFDSVVRVVQSYSIAKEKLMEEINEYYKSSFIQDIRKQDTQKT